MSRLFAVERGRRARLVGRAGGLGCGWLVVLLLSAASAGCQQTPQEFVTDFEWALNSGDQGQVADRLTPESRPIYGALVAAGPAVGEGASPFAPRQGGKPATVSRVLPIDDGVMIELKIGDTQREWILTRAGGRFRLDLLATATRRPYTGF